MKMGGEDSVTTYSEWVAAMSDELDALYELLDGIERDPILQQMQQDYAVIRTYSDQQTISNAVKTLNEATEHRVISREDHSLAFDRETLHITTEEDRNVALILSERNLGNVQSYSINHLGVGRAMVVYHDAADGNRYLTIAATSRANQRGLARKLGLTTRRRKPAFAA